MSCSWRLELDRVDIWLVEVELDSIVFSSLEVVDSFSLYFSSLELSIFLVRFIDLLSR